MVVRQLTPGGLQLDPRRRRGDRLLDADAKTITEASDR